MHKSIYLNSKSTIQNTVYYSRQEKFFWQFTCARLGPSSGPFVTPRCALDRNYAKLVFTLRTVWRRREHRPGTKLGPSANHLPIENKRNPKVTSSIKFIFSVLANRPRCTVDCQRLLYLTSDDAFNALIAIDIAITANRCDFSRWCAWVDRLYQECGPSGWQKVKWSVAINTIPTTSIHLIQASHSFTFNTRASTAFQDTFKASKLFQVT